MADKKNPGDPTKSLKEDSIVSRFRERAGGDAPTGVTSYVGLLGRSSRAGYWLLYPTLDMSTSIEIAEADIVSSDALPPEQSPFGGLGGTRVFVRMGAQVTTTRTISRTYRAGAGDDDFDLDVRVGQGSPASIRATCATLGGEESCGGTNTCASCFGTCLSCTCNTCVRTCGDTCGRSCGGQNTCAETWCSPTCPGQNTCGTCATQCNQPTCANTCPNTCANTCANTCPNTCNTCPTNCGTCATCWTNCGTCEPTCRTCPANTCGCPPPTLRTCLITACQEC